MADVQDGTLQLGRLAGSLGFMVRITQLAIFDAFYDRLSRFGMKPGTFSILYLIDQNAEARQGEIAERLRIKRAHMTKLVRSLEARELIERRIPDDDRRSVLLRLTARGRAFVADHAEAFFGYQVPETGRLTGAERAELIRLLQKFNGIEGRP